VLANTVLADVVTQLGTPMTLDAALDTFMGKQLGEVLAAIAAVIGRPVADGIAAELMRRTLSRFRADLREVPGVRQYLVAFPHVERCIASSSSADRLAACLDILGLSELFGAHVYSAALVPRGKPHPDLFLHAARQLGVAPADTIVIEDSDGGVRAAIAAGMTPIGFLGGSHIRAGHEERLRSAGAHDIAYTYADLEAITRRLVQ
jgi:HAD superfamily hydrolase (TIGR01509 family)